MKTFGRLAALLLAFAAAPSFAAITCNVTVTAITTVYSPTVATDNVSTGQYTISCTRLATDANSLAWSLAADNGQQSGGGNNRVQSAAGNRYAYDLYIDPAHTTKWQGGTRFTGTLSFGASLSASVTGSFDLVVFKSQTVQPASTYNDIVTVTLRNTANNNTLDTSPFTVTVITTNSCQISTPPPDIIFTYTSFQAAAATASTSFSVRCTTALPYSMALDTPVPFPASILGLTYSLTLSQSNATGNGLPQAYSINGSIGGGQAGQCATATCSGSQARTLTVSY